VLSEVQRLLVLALHDARPAERLRQLVADAGDGLTPDERARLLAADADGLRVTSLIVRKLRFERILRGDAALRAACDRDRAAFAAEFARYCAAVPPTSAFPAEEARAFRRFAGGA
jgi:hypothetical protein